MSDAIGELVTTHWNLQKKSYSIKLGRDPVYNVPQLHLRECAFVIDRRLRAMFDAAPNRRTVHALIKGRLIGYDTADIAGETVRCNPFLFDSFVRGSDERTVVYADEVFLHPDKRIEARGLRLG